MSGFERSKQKLFSVVFENVHQMLSIMLNLNLKHWHKQQQTPQRHNAFDLPDGSLLSAKSLILQIMNIYTRKSVLRNVNDKYDSSHSDAGKNTLRMGSSMYACGADQRECLMGKDVARHIQPFQRRAYSLSATMLKK